MTGFILKLLDVPGGGVLTVLSLSTLAILYFPLSFYFFSDKNVKTQNQPLSIISGFFLSLVPIGIMFKLQYWPGYEANLIVAFISATILTGVGYFLKQKAPEELKTYYKQFLSRVIILAFLSGAFFLTPMRTLIKIQSWRDPEFSRLSLQAFDNPQNEEYRKELNDYWDKKNKQE